jgi:hypothetical protein
MIEDFANESSEKHARQIAGDDRILEKNAGRWLGMNTQELGAAIYGWVIDNVLRVEPKPSSGSNDR